MADDFPTNAEITSNGKADGASDLETITYDEDQVTLKVGGVVHETTMQCLSAKPTTRLGATAMRYLHSTRRTFTFDRHPGVFTSVIDYYRSGELHVPLDVCGAVVKRELDYWQIDESLIEPCCWTCYSSYIDNQKTLAEFNRSFQQEQEELDRIKSLTGREKKKMSIWMMLDHPNSSKLALGYAVTSFVFVLVSIAGFVLETIPDFQNTDNTTHRCENGVPTPHPVLEKLDLICTAFFTLEVIVRLIFAPNKVKFFCSIMNFIDFLALLPLYVQIILEQTEKYSCITSNRAVIETIFILRIVRIFRVFHLVKHYNALKILVHAIKASTQELLMLSIFLVIAMLVFATLAFYAENRGTAEAVTGDNDELRFNTIPMGFWWAIITMTTVGYGDIFPYTPMGQCIGVICAVWGVLLIALTIPVISNNFSLFYLHGRTREQLTKNVARKRKESEQNEVRMRLAMLPGQIHKHPLGVEKSLLLSVESNSTDESGIVAHRESTEDTGHHKPDQAGDAKEESSV